MNNTLTTYLIIAFAFSFGSQNLLAQSKAFKIDRKITNCKSQLLEKFNQEKPDGFNMDANEHSLPLIEQTNIVCGICSNVQKYTIKTTPRKTTQFHSFVSVLNKEKISDPKIIDVYKEPFQYRKKACEAKGIFCLTHVIDINFQDFETSPAVFSFNYKILAYDFGIPQQLSFYKTKTELNEPTSNDILSDLLESGIEFSRSFRPNNIWQHNKQRVSLSTTLTCADLNLEDEYKNKYPAD